MAQNANKNAWTNEIKKGMRIQQVNGWFGTMMDNKKGNIRLAEVEGFCTEIGSIYAKDIARYQDADGVWHERPGQAFDDSDGIDAILAEFGY